jgi:hypothetical protein
VCVGRAARSERVAEKEPFHERTSGMDSARGSIASLLCFNLTRHLDSKPVFFFLLGPVFIHFTKIFESPPGSESVSLSRRLFQPGMSIGTLNAKVLVVLGFGQVNN